MNLIQKCGGQGMAELILSCCMTKAIGPHCYMPEYKVYGAILDDCLYYFNEESNQYLKFGSLEESKGQYFLLTDLKAELAEGVV